MNIIYCLINYGTHFEAKSWIFQKFRMSSRLSIFSFSASSMCFKMDEGEEIYCLCESVPFLYVLKTHT